MSKATINTDLPVFYQSTTRNDGHPFQVYVISIKGAFAQVETMGSIKEKFTCRVSSLYNN